MAAVILTNYKWGPLGSLSELCYHVCMQSDVLDALLKDISGKEYRDTAQTDTALWLIQNVRRFSRESRLWNLDAGTQSGKKHRQNRPCLTAGMTNTREYRTIFLTASERRFEISVSPCNARCQNFPFFDRSYVFEWPKGNLVLLPADLFKDESSIRFCGRCPEETVIPEDVMHACFVP